MSLLRQSVNFVNDIKSTVNRVTSAVNTAGSAINTVRGTINTLQNFASDPIEFITNNRLQNFPIGAEVQQRNFTSASWNLSAGSAGNDWRVRLHMPSSAPGFTTSPILEPLYNSGNSMVFPVTPQVMVVHTAAYNQLSPVHTNYPFQVYQNSTVEEFTVNGEFPVENEADGRYWIAAVHFLRSVTKMYYGESNTRGAPPPVVHMSGYGDFVFNRLPVVVKMFTLDLPTDVDYLQVPVSGDVNFELDIARNSPPGGYTYVPTLSRISISLAPAYSRDRVRQFSLETYVNGGYIGNDSGFV